VFVLDGVVGRGALGWLWDSLFGTAADLGAAPAGNTSVARLLPACSFVLCVYFYVHFIVLAACIRTVLYSLAICCVSTVLLFTVSQYFQYLLRTYHLTILQ
jgi:hypothetical protein